MFDTDLAEKFIYNYFYLGNFTVCANSVHGEDQSQYLICPLMLVPNYQFLAVVPFCRQLHFHLCLINTSFIFSILHLPQIMNHNFPDVGYSYLCQKLPFSL